MGNKVIHTEAIAHTVTNNGEDQLASNYFAILEGIWATTQVSAQPTTPCYDIRDQKEVKKVHRN